MLRVEHLSAHAGDPPLSFDIPNGQTTGLLGRDAAALFRIIETIGGLRAPVAGNVRINGLDIDVVRHPERARPLIALSLMRAIHRQTSLGEHAGVIAATRPCRMTTNAALDRLGLDPRMRLNTPAARSAASLVAALLPDAAVVLLHEPFRDLDAGTREKAIEWIRSLSETPASILFAGTEERDVRAVSHKVVDLGAGR